jgi:hypothetical protein
MIPDHCEVVVDGERGAGGCWSTRSTMCTHRTLRNDVFDIREERMRKWKINPKNLGVLDRVHGSYRVWLDGYVSGLANAIS